MVTEARPAKLQKAAVRAASRGAAAAASSSDAPATIEEARPAAPGFRPKVSETEEAARPYGVTIDALRGRARERTRSAMRQVRQVALDELQPHDESGAVIQGEPNSTIRVQSAPKQRIKSVDRVSPPPKKPREASKARTPSIPAVAGKGKSSNSTAYVCRPAPRASSDRWLSAKHIALLRKCQAV